jgi:eukaryotic-like serine/threonine-protein kinase
VHARERIGQTLASKYRLEDLVGSGGMGDVYRATNTAIGRTVAIKLLRPELAQYPEIVERFLREARTANRVNHPNVVDVTDIGQDADGTPFIVEEFLEGETLLQFAMRRGGKLTLSELADIIGPVLSAVAEAHASGVVHRDLKPENVFLAGRRGKRIPKVLDFGISKAREAESELTKVGVVMGTPAYMPPELVASFRDADTRTDVWALGVIIFELLAGRMPFDGSTIGEVFHAVAKKDAQRLSDWADVPEALADVVARCLKRNPLERYVDAAALAVDLAHAIEERAPEAAKKWSLLPQPLEARRDAAKEAAPPKIDAKHTALHGQTIPLVPKKRPAPKQEKEPIGKAEATPAESKGGEVPATKARRIDSRDLLLIVAALLLGAIALIALTRS